MIKLVVTDLDGTALDRHKELDQGLKEAKAFLKEKGIPLTFATGRGEGIMQRYVDEIELEIPYITDNGALIYKDHEPIEMHAIPSEYNDFILKTLYDHGIPFTAYTTKEVYANGTSAFFKERTSYYDPFKVPYEDTMHLEDKQIFKITTDYQDCLDQLDPVVKLICDACPDIEYLNAEHDVHVINSKHANKAEGIINLCKILNISKEEVMAFGDAGTDKALLSAAGIAVAMKNAEDDIKAIADYICEDNDHQGVSQFIHQYFK